MEMTEEYFNRMTDEEKAEYLNKIIEEAANAASGKKRVGTGVRSKAPRNIASRKPVKR